jgi:hypothetical protein
VQTQFSRRDTAGHALTHWGGTSGLNVQRRGACDGTYPAMRRRRMAYTPTPTSNASPASKPLRVTAGAAAVVLVHVPRAPLRSHRSCAPVHAVLQHTPSTQKLVEQAAGVVHSPPCGTPVFVGVVVGGWVGVAVGVCVGVSVGVAVAVSVGVAVGVWVGVVVGTGTPLMNAQPMKAPCPQVAALSSVAAPHGGFEQTSLHPSMSVKHWGAPLGHGCAPGSRHRQQYAPAPPGASNANSARAQVVPWRWMSTRMLRPPRIANITVSHDRTAVQRTRPVTAMRLPCRATQAMEARRVGAARFADGCRASGAHVS